ncbi:site-2 protease family protein [Streptomonospora nanhaiensis]|uniref:Zn-dependent protease n=1 Tax=Streptomonospora nanhaiensis TaxID=1323731 RepID=A0A853BR46_9ACTN|nr:site-2 protease family protein [Streptomonospora nanhaiensis]MBV2362778.1 site-2 protease family protein [Streptomonospora nanhaiensis]MBX9388759.1 site-2 protease family protein [Streptomonospora nanhaiensis]NYI97868.1 Zn-dependent protease [Streptomonospora nanhaiensis]
MSAPEPTDRDDASTEPPAAPAGGATATEAAAAAPEQPEAAQAPAEGGTGAPAAAAARSRADLLPSPFFVLLVGVCGLAGWLSWTRAELSWGNDGATVYVPALFILTGWAVSIALHEFGHAATAHALGDRSLRGGAYLRLNPFGYGELFANLLMPLAFVLFGGVGLTGPAGYVDHAAVGGRGRRSAVAAAGIGVSLVLAAALAAAVAALVPAGMFTDNWMLGGLMYLCYLNLTVALVNVLPVPGLDGFDVVAPFLPERLVARVRPWGVFGVIAVFAVLWVPTVNVAVPTLLIDLFAAVGLPQIDIGFGEVLLRFWA